MSWPSNSARTKTWGTEILTASDLDGQLDLLHQYFIDSLNATTGHKHSGGANDGPLIPLTTGVTGTLPLANGGTGQTTLAALLNLVYPVGSIYANASVSTNPGTLLGFGTWVAIGGFLAGLDGSTEFNSAGQTGGAKTATIAQANLPSYNLSATVYNANGSGLTGIQGTTNGATASTANVPSGGSGTAVSILPPYTVMYCWKRTV